MKSIKKVVLLTTLVVCLAGCSLTKVVKLMKNGEVQPEKFKVEVPFEYRLDLIIVKVNISGEVCDFILDTGAPNVISKKLAKKMGVTSITEKEVGDSQGESDNLGFTTISKLSIGNLDFLNTGAVIADLELSEDIRCLNIEGFIGSNLMRKAVWKVDFENQIITITNSINSLKIPEAGSKIPFYTQVTGTPLIDVEVNNVIEKNVTFDLGSNGGIDLAKKTFDRLKKKNFNLSYTSSFGTSTSGLYGLGKKDSTFYVNGYVASLGNVSIQNAMVNFFGESESTIGTEFFRNYDVIINWFRKEIILVEKQKYKNSSLTSFGFGHQKQDNHLVISQIYEGVENLKIGDQILKIEDTTYETISQEQWCEILENGLFKKEMEVARIVLLRDGKELTYKLKKIKLL